MTFHSQMKSRKPTPEIQHGQILPSWFEFPIMNLKSKKLLEIMDNYLCLFISTTNPFIHLIMIYISCVLKMLTLFYYFGFKLIFLHLPWTMFEMDFRTSSAKSLELTNSILKFVREVYQIQ